MPESIQGKAIIECEDDPEKLFDVYVLIWSIV